MEKKKPNTERTITAVPEGPARFAHRYTEADIAWLETLDLTDQGVGSALHRAYMQNDPDFTTLVLRPSSFLYSIGTEDELRERIADTEKQLKASPKSYDLRLERFEAMRGLAQLAKYKAGQRS